MYSLFLYSVTPWRKILTKLENLLFFWKSMLDPFFFNGTWSYKVQGLWKNYIWLKNSYLSCWTLHFNWTMCFWQKLFHCLIFLIQRCFSHPNPCSRYTFGIFSSLCIRFMILVQFWMNFIILFQKCCISISVRNKCFIDFGAENRVLKTKTCPPVHLVRSTPPSCYILPEAKISKD